MKKIIKQKKAPKIPKSIEEIGPPGDGATGGYTFQQIGDHLGLSGQRVQQIEAGIRDKFFKNKTLKYWWNLYFYGEINDKNLL